jgi:hypothetical protein
MLLVLEIALTIAALLRGWKGWALLPLGMGIGLGFLVGLVMGASGASADGAFAIGLLLDLICIVTLIVMVVKPRRKSQQVIAGNLVAPVASVAPVVREPLNRPVNVKLATRIVPATVVYPVAKARLMLPDSSEISLTEAVRPIGRSDFDKAASPEALKYISRQHLLIRSGGGSHFAEDHNSANGTKINGVEIKGKGRQELKDGDRIEVADVVALTFKTCDLI